MKEGKEREKRERKEKTEGAWLQCALTPLLRNFNVGLHLSAYRFHFSSVFLSITSQPMFSSGHNLVNGKERTLVSLLSHCLKGNEGRETKQEGRKLTTTAYSV